MTAVSKAANKLKFETGDIPTQTDFADFIDSSPNIVDGNLLVEYDITVVPVTPPVQGTAYPLTKYFNYNEGIVAPLAAILAPPALVSREFIYVNNGGDAVTMFGDGSDTFDLNNAFTELVIPAYSQVNFICPIDGQWNYTISDIFFSSSALSGSTDMISAVSPSDQSTATPLTTLTNNITGGNVAGAGVLLPSAVRTRVLYLRYATTYPLDIYPSSGEIIDGTGVDVPLRIQYNVSMIFFCTTGGLWSFIKQDAYVGAYDVVGFDDNMAAIFPSVQATGVPITKKFNHITTSPTGVCGALLPPAKPSMIIYISVASANSVDVYPASGEKFINASTNAAVQVTQGHTLTCVCSKTGVWSWTYGGI